MPWSELRLDVSNETSTLRSTDSGAVTTLYSSWQLLLAADMGAHYRINLTDSEAHRQALEAIRTGKPPPAQSRTLYFEPVYVFREFAQQERTLEALVWFVEETGRVARLVEIG